MADAPILPVTMVIAGGYLAWFGIHYWRSDVKYPTTPVKSVLTGQPVTPAGTRPAPLHATLTADVQALQPDPGTQQPSTGQNPTTPATGGGGGTPDQNKALAKMLAISMGHADWTTGSQWTDWQSLWEGESGWSQYADTRKSGLDPANATVFAYGIPQSRPYSKMPKPGWPADKGGSSDPRSQITWGIEYIAQTYSSPSSALAFKVSTGGKGY